jgi:hypothetical protein
MKENIEEANKEKEFFYQKFSDGRVQRDFF